MLSHLSISSSGVEDETVAYESGVTIVKCRLLDATNTLELGRSTAGVL